ncbi:MAG: hypothetical protein ABIB43_01350 [archaeon]
MTRILKGKSQIAENDFMNLSPNIQYKKLELNESKNHIFTLNSMLKHLKQYVSEEFSNKQDIGELEGFIDSVYSSLDTMLLKQQIEEMTNKRFADKLRLDQTDSGYPITIFEFNKLALDKKIAEEELKKLPSDKQIVDSALYTIFSGLFPKDSILKKIQKDYFTALTNLENLTEMHIGEEKEVNLKDNKYSMTKSFYQMSSIDNIPRLYTAYFSVPAESYTRESWRQELNAVIGKGTSPSPTIDLKVFSSKMEEIDGVILKMIERSDIGPFYNKYTKNSEQIDALLKNTSDQTGILEFKQHVILRTDQSKIKGFTNYIKSVLSKDMYIGNFSPVIEQPKTIFMPYRLVQKVHNKGINLGKQAQIIGI